VHDCGETFAEATQAEVSFVFNVLSFFQQFLRKETFLEWVASM
jgi:hypothetical protein